MHWLTTVPEDLKACAIVKLDLTSITRYKPDKSDVTTGVTDDQAGGDGWYGGCGG